MADDRANKQAERRPGDLEQGRVEGPVGDLAPLGGASRLQAQADCGVGSKSRTAAKS